VKSSEFKRWIEKGCTFQPAKGSDLSIRCRKKRSATANARCRKRDRQRTGKPHQDGTLLVDVSAIPEAHTFGDNRSEALLRAVDAIETALMSYIENRRNIPRSDAKTARGTFVALPAPTQAKIELYQTLLAAGVTRSELARRLNIPVQQVDCLLDFRRASRLDQVEAAFHALGKQLSISVHEAA